MAEKPILLFLHGVGVGDPEGTWQAVLSGSFARLGYPALESEHIIAPQYSYALRHFDEKERLPGITTKQPTRDDARRNRRAFEQRTSSLEFRLGRLAPGSGWVGGETLVQLAFDLPPFKQAQNYLSDSSIRAQVLNRILSKLPPAGKVLIVGHSLGSVIAVDLIRRLPPQLEVVGMVTIGSPLANGSVDVDDLRETLVEPPVNLGWWVNFWNAFDPVAAHRGLSSVFPWMLDYRVMTTPTPRVHDAREYLADETVAKAIGYGLYGSLVQDVVPVLGHLEVPLDATEEMVLLGLRYAHLISGEIKGETRDRYLGALRQVQATAVGDLLQQRARAGRATPESLRRLTFDLADPQVEVPAPTPTRHLEKDAAVVLFTVLATENVLRPFDITVPREQRKRAMEELAAEAGLTSRFGATVFDVMQGAQEIVNGSKSVNWLKVGVLGAGAVALVVGTGGLALAAAPGLVGAAAITSALAAFGPGGMIGGLITAGGLLTAGGSGIAFGLAGAGTSAETVEAVITRQLMLAELRKLHDLDQDAALWHNLVETERQVRREHERLDEFSDPTSPNLKDLQRKIRAIARALDALRSDGLEP